MPLAVQAKSLEEIERRLISTFGFPDPQVKRLLAELKKEPEEIIKNIGGRVSTIADGEVQISRALTIIMQSVFTTDQYIKDTESELGVFYEVFTERKGELERIFDAYVSRLEAQYPDIRHKLEQQKTLTLAIHGKLEAGKTKLIGFIKMEFQRAGYKADKLDLVISRIEKALPKAREHVKRIGSKAANGEDELMSIIGMAQELVQMQEASLKKVPRVTIVRDKPQETFDVKRTPKGIKFQESINVKSEVSVMDPEVQEEVAQTSDEVATELGKIMTKFSVLNARLETVTALLKNLDQDVESYLAGFEEPAIS